jgi:hypothetical protein
MNWKDKESRRLYDVWTQMQKRCDDDRNPSFKDYGGRGIFVCESWRSFDQFIADMGPRPVGAVMDRIDNDGPYIPGNCRWTNRIVSSGNRRNCLYVERNGERVALKTYMRAAGMIADYRMVAKRIQKGMAIADALVVPRRIWPNS